MNSGERPWQFQRLLAGATPTDTDTHGIQLAEGALYLWPLSDYSVLFNYRQGFLAQIYEKITATLIGAGFKREKSVYGVNKQPSAAY